MGNQDKFYADTSRAGEKLQQEIAELRASGEAFHDLVGCMNDVIYATGPDGVIVYVSPSASGFSGYEPSEIIGKSFSEFIHEEDFSTIIEKLRRYGDNSSILGEYRFLTKSGQIKWARVSNKPIFEGGRVVGTRGIVTDISQNGMRKEVLWENKELNGALARVLPDLIIATDLNGYITSILQQTLDLWDSDNDSGLIGKSLFELIAPEDREEAMVDFQKAMTEGSIRDLEYIFEGKDDTRFIGEVKTALVKGANGKPELVIITVRKITERRWVAEYSGYEKTYSDRYGTITKRNESLHRLASIGRLSLNLAHELNNPLDGARRYVRLLMDRMNGDATGRVYAELASDGLIRALRTIRGLLDFARIGTLPLRPTEVRYAIERILRFLSNEISSRNIEVRTEFGENIPVLDANIDQIFTNIIKNAIEAMAEGGTIFINTERVSSQLVEVRLRDTGPGIDPEIQERIFDPFFTTKDFGQCIGLGLSISREIAESYGGSIDVESEPGKGTTFIVRLPIYKGNVLIMDDEKYIRDVTSNVLGRLGYKVATAVNGTEAVELCREAISLGQPYDAVILDLIVPNSMGGKEAFQELKKIDPEIKAIAFSGYPNDPVLTNFQEYGFKNIIIKPYTIEKLEKVMQEVIMERGNYGS